MTFSILLGSRDLCVKVEIRVYNDLAVGRQLERFYLVIG
jgi:hypothetical protein